MHIAPRALRSMFKKPLIKTLTSQIRSLGDSYKNKTPNLDTAYAPTGDLTETGPYLSRRGEEAALALRYTDPNPPHFDFLALPRKLADIPEHRNKLRLSPNLFGNGVKNSIGIDFTNLSERNQLQRDMEPYLKQLPNVQEIVCETLVTKTRKEAVTHYQPANLAVGAFQVRYSTVQSAAAAIDSAKTWDVSSEERSRVITKAADLIQEKTPQLVAQILKETGKPVEDCLFEIREAQDFGYTYAQSNVTKPPMGKVLCVSPWNIPLGIMLGQVMAALAAGNAVIATSAEQTSGTAALAVQLLHQAGVPKDVLQLVLGDVNIKQSMVSNPALDAILFTGSLQSARAIQRSIVRPIPVYAETSAIANAMIIDASINLLSRMPDIVKSAFGSSGQLCSSAAFIFVDEAIYDMFIENFIGHLNTKQIGDPLNPSTFIGPLNNDNHLKNIQKLVQEEIDKGNLLYQSELQRDLPEGYFYPITVLTGDLNSLNMDYPEFFGPVVRVVSFPTGSESNVIKQINDINHSITLGIETSSDKKAAWLASHSDIGMTYLGTATVGAVPFVQPFDGRGKSGNSVKVGSPDTPGFFTKSDKEGGVGSWDKDTTKEELLNKIKKKTHNLNPINSIPRDWVTGISTTVVSKSKKPIICAGPGKETAKRQADKIESLGGTAIIPDGKVDPSIVAKLPIGGLVYWGDETEALKFTQAFSKRSSDPIINVITGKIRKQDVIDEKTITNNRTVSGFNQDYTIENIEEISQSEVERR